MSAEANARGVGLFADQIVAARLATRFAALDPAALLRLVVRDLFPGRVALVSSFGADLAVLLHMIAGIEATTPVVFIDTGQLFPETLAYRDALVAHLGLRDVRTIGPQPDLASRDSDGFLWARDPDRCCDIRKVAPLARALAPYEAWITGRKRFQSATRAGLALFEAEGERVKVNPLAGWAASDIPAYLAAHDLPRHPLAGRGYPSIGCLPCTSPVRPDDPRSGRWRGRGKAECGIHLGALDAGSGI